MISTLQGRINYLCNLSLFLILICFAAFSRPALYRMLSEKHPKCQQHSWYTEATKEYTCDHKPLDFHAILAIAWLLVFTTQVLTLKFKLRQFHRIFGSSGFVVAFANIIGILTLSLSEIINPMKESSRPPIFNPFMMLLGLKILSSLWNSYVAIRQKKKHNVEDHIVWIVRAFASSCVTAMLRVYPMILRAISSDKCMNQNRDRIVMSGTVLAGFLICWINVLINANVRRVFWDSHLKTSVLQAVLFFVAYMVIGKTHGFLFLAVYECVLQENGHDMANEL